VSAATDNIIVPLCCCTHGPKLPGLGATLEKIGKHAQVSANIASKELHVTSLATPGSRDLILATLKADGFLCDCRPVQAANPQ
jgi:hypothetical protein